MSVSRSIRRLARIGLDAHAWRPSALALLSDGVAYRRRNEVHGYTDRDHLVAAAAWLARAQDVTGDGGVAGRYCLDSGWTSSYPETTGYIVPTFLALEAEAGLAGFRDRAGRCVEFLLGVQLPSGAFPAREIAENRDQPSVFNTAQILHGLTAWHIATSDECTLAAARRAADWLVAAQDADGAWRRHLYGSGRTYTYMAHAGCWLAAFGAHVGDEGYLAAARAHLSWVLTHVDETSGWIADCGFDDDGGTSPTAVTHTIAYTIWGVLLLSQILADERGLSVARTAAHAVARRLELSRWLPGRLDSRWRPASPSTCLTGNAQMALIWFALHELDGDPSLVSTACKAIDLVKRAQPMTVGDPDIRGGIPGSDPVWGEYITLAVPNWAAKFFIDAILAKTRALRSLRAIPVSARDVPRTVPDGVPTELAHSDGSHPGERARVVLLADEFSPKVEQFCEAWAHWDFRPDAVVTRQPRATSRSVRVREYVRDYGVVNLARRAGGLRTRLPASPIRHGTLPTSGMPVSRYCHTRGILAVPVASLEAAADLERVRALDADVFVYAGCGIMRPPLLALSRLGTLNAHMGLLPPMRGMNVAEWSVMCGAPVGCTVHLIDRGIDTGDTFVFAPVDIANASSIDAMRQRVDAAQIGLLGRVVRWVRDHGRLPPRRPQHASEGRQYFAMHADVRAILDEWLRERA